MKSDYRWLLAVLVLFGVLFAIKALGEQGRLGRWSFTKSVDVKSAGDNRATYFRLKVNLAYKGEPLDFDIVVGCNVRVTTYKDNDRTVEVGVAPMVYGLKMKDGRGVVVRPPEACDGQTTENGKVPKALLPLIATYENADAPWFGLAYASEDAYDSPISELKFFGATIGNATREEWQEWRRTEAPKNFITYEILGINEKNRWEQPRWKPGYRAMGSICAGVSRVHLPEPVRDAIRPYWPASKPDYWYPNEEAKQAFRAAGDYRGRKIPFEGSPLYGYFSTGAHFLGLPRRKPGAMIFFTGHVAGEVYPASSDLSLNRLDAAGELSAEINAKTRMGYSEANVSPELKGFATCDVVRNIAGVPSAINFPAGRLYANRINGEQINEELQRSGSNFDYAFERDENIYFYKDYSLVTIFGGL
jgi:hypothetical protein